MDNLRWRWGETNPVVAAVDSSTEVEIGDLVYQDTDDVKPASSQADQGNETANQELFADRVLGVAMHRSRSGDANPIRVATTGVFVFDCPSGTFELGDLIGADKMPGYDALLNQQVDKVAEAKYAIGRVAQRKSTLTTSVLVDIRSRVMGVSI